MTETDVRSGPRHTTQARRRPAGTGPRNRPTDTGNAAPGTAIAVDGLLDIVDEKAWLRAGGYLPGADDIPVAPAQIHVHGLRRGDHVTGIAHLPNGRKPATLEIASVNGRDPRRAGSRPDFYKLTALYPQERLRLETAPQVPTTRVIDLVMPIGKGQRALIVSQPKAGKTMVLQAIANAITQNNPECHLMVVLVDERPEEVTDMQRSVRGEVIAATFDRPPTDHTALAELAIEHAKRLVEDGRDVVVLLDSITRLGRSYNLAAPARGRTLSGGIDTTALHPPKRFLGAARNIENGGSLTIIATALVDTGSAMDTVIFEEFKSTGNAELKLDRSLAEARIFPAIDVSGSGTRHDETLVAPTELALMYQLRRALSGEDRRQSMRRLLDHLKTTGSNAEFLRRAA
ncbi:transcription termination factor Rho [Krasilnikovia cinnamomea]|uniref:Transcription termination factor Rho n=1 Tax=Krasilnikovia cinnamomea TaxID=349313 RepID=A0A4Q7ZLZ8_9ACTN|nr:transcription termination factor Rho [Krasilnikovia cinnamomea]